jgi:hypothetical protein
MKKNLLVVLAVVMMMFVMSSHVSADTMALTFTGGTPYGYVTDPLPNTIGWEFSITAPVSVTSLGFFDMDSNGLILDHQVSIWGLAQNQIVSAVVTNSDPLDQGFRWASVSPVTLAAGTYRIGASIDAVLIDDVIDYDRYYSSTSSRILAAPVSYNGGVYHLGGFAYPENIGFTNNGRFGPNFQFNPETAVPEPSTSILVGAGLVGFGLLRKRFRK